MSCSYTPSQNGRAERKHRHVMKIGLALLFHSHVPLRHWVDAFSTTTYIINRLPMPVLGGLSLFEVLSGKPPNYVNFHPFGCRVYPCLRDYAPHKFSPCSLPCIFLGYSSSHKGFRCFDTTTSCTYITWHAWFDEIFFPFSNTSSPVSISAISFSNFYEPCSLEPPSSTSSPTTTQVSTTPHVIFVQMTLLLSPCKFLLLLPSPRLLQLQSRSPLYLLRTWLLLQFPWTRFMPLLH